MKLITKAALLVSLLALPVFIYIFLQLFGQNYYELPIYYQDGVSNPPINCQKSHSTPLRVDLASLKDNANISKQGKISIIAFMASDCGKNCQIKLNQINRLVNFFLPQKDSLQAIVAVEGNRKEDVFLQFNNSGSLYFVSLTEIELQDFIECELLLPLSDQNEVEHINQFVLLDEQNRIRGYYNGLSLEEIDRLTTEIRLLLYEYQHQS